MSTLQLEDFVFILLPRHTNIFKNSTLFPLDFTLSNREMDCETKVGTEVGGIVLPGAPMQNHNTMHKSKHKQRAKHNNLYTLLLLS